MSTCIDAATITNILHGILNGRSAPLRNNKSFHVRHVPYVFRPSDDVLEKYNIAKDSERMLNYYNENHVLAKDFVIEVPDWQRHYVWTIDQLERLINTVLNNFPMPNIIIAKASKGRGVFSIEDGQQRLTTLFLYMNNAFPINVSGYRIYYDEVPASSNRKTKKGTGTGTGTGTGKATIANITLADVGLKETFDNYLIDVQDVSGFSEDDRAEMFERLNSGKSLSDGDRYWNRRQSAMVKMAENIAKGVCKDDLQKHFGISWSDITTHKTRNTLCDLMGIIAGLSVNDNNDPSWADVCSKSFKKVNKYLDADNLASESKVEERLSVLLDTYSAAYDDAHPSRNTQCQNRAFSRWLGPMIMDLRKMEMEMEQGEGQMECIVSSYQAKWIPILRAFSSDVHHIDSVAHPHHVMYAKDLETGFPIDNPHKNTTGQLIASRLALINEVFGC